jgi:DNA-binding NarL/FixJ family response regulator
VSTELPSVVIADDHAMARAGIQISLESGGFRVVGEASSARGAVEQALEHRPDICLLDVHMPGSGISAASQIRELVPQSAIVMMTYSREDRDLLDALRAGAIGYLLKDMDPDRVAIALHSVLAGEPAVPRRLVNTLVEELRGRPGRRVVLGDRKVAELTSREWEIFQLLDEGLSTAEVAGRLFLSSATVRVHVAKVVRKLRVPDRAAALRILKEQASAR